VTTFWGLLNGAASFLLILWVVWKISEVAGRGTEWLINTLSGKVRLMARTLMKLEVTPVDGSDTYRLELTSRDFLIWERTGRNRTFQSFMENISVTGLYELSHLAARREGLFGGNLPDWQAAVDVNAVDPDQKTDGEMDEDPTR
jgi:hypothetical protein